MAPKPVILYGTAGCALCETARAFLRGRGIEFADVEIAGNPAALGRLSSLTGQIVVPTIVAGEDVQVGWDELRMAEMFDDPLPDEEDDIEAGFRALERRLKEEI